MLLDLDEGCDNCDAKTPPQRSRWVLSEVADDDIRGGSHDGVVPFVVGGWWLVVGGPIHL